MSLLVVGTVAFDALETPFGKTDKIVGGSALYFCWSASNFLKAINLVSVVGGDYDFDEIKAMQNRGINTEGLQVKQDEKTFFWSGRYHLDMNTRDTMETQLNVLEHFDPILPESAQECDFLMLGNLSPVIQLKAIQRMKKRPKLIAMDTMNFWMDIQLPELKTVLKEVDILLLNDEEARQLSGQHSLVKAAKIIKAMGPRYLIIKKGEHGALLFHDQEIFFSPALPLEDVFDPTGAGDTFAGGFIGYLASTGDVSFENMKRGVIFGSALASFCVEKFGHQRLTEVTLEGLQDRVQQFVDLVQFDTSLVG